jgi:hypothetical protein
VRLRRRIERLERASTKGRTIFLMLEDPYAEEHVPASPETVAAAIAHHRAIHGPNVEIIRFVIVANPYAGG